MEAAGEARICRGCPTDRAGTGPYVSRRSSWPRLSRSWARLWEGGFNAYYTARVCDAAYHLYRERFLAKKYGPGVIDLTAEPAEGPGFEPRYSEADEEILSGRGIIDSDDRI